MSEVYGRCGCGGSLSPVMFEEQESIIKDGRLTWTNRYRRAVSSLDCRECFRSYPVDDTFDGNWYKKY